MSMTVLIGKGFSYSFHICNNKLIDLIPNEAVFEYQFTSIALLMALNPIAYQ